MEIIICSAVQYHDGTVIRGHRHNDALKTLFSIPRINKDFEDKKAMIIKQGFITSKNRFVERKEALQIQLKAGIKSHRGKYQNQLYSEDLY